MPVCPHSLEHRALFSAPLQLIPLLALQLCMPLVGAGMGVTALGASVHPCLHPSEMWGCCAEDAPSKSVPHSLLGAQNRREQG